jgi:DNA repair exonuclease SbcCD nuclease subunit
MNNLIVVGDLHAREKEPYFSQWKDFMDWLFLSEHNQSNNTLLLLGDLVESISVQHELLEVYIDYFNNKSNFEKIIILTGNHDRVLNSSLLSIFRPLKRVEVIEELLIRDFGNCKCLFLPHIESKLVETYSSLQLTEKFDYCFHHVEDESQHFGKTFADLTSLHVGQYLCGHIHTETVTKGNGHYLGSPTFNSLNEKGKTPYIAIIDLDTKKHTLVKVPVWISYCDVFYPNELTVPETKYCIYTIYDSIDKEQCVEYYTKQATEKGFTFYHRRVHGKRIKNDDLSVNKEFSIDEKSLIEYYNDYKTINNVDDNVSSICIELLQKVEEK